MPGSPPLCLPPVSRPDILFYSKTSCIQLLSEAFSLLPSVFVCSIFSNIFPEENFCLALPGNSAGETKPNPAPEVHSIPRPCSQTPFFFFSWHKEGKAQKGRMGYERLRTRGLNFLFSSSQCLKILKIFVNTKEVFNPPTGIVPLRIVR